MEEYEKRHDNNKIRLKIEQDEINPNRLNLIWDYNQEELNIIYDEILPILNLDEVLKPYLGTNTHLEMIEIAILGRIKEMEICSGITFNEYIKRRLQGYEITLKHSKDILWPYSYTCDADFCSKEGYEIPSITQKK